MYVNKLAGKERKTVAAAVRVHSPADYMEWLVRRFVVSIHVFPLAHHHPTALFF